MSRSRLSPSRALFIVMAGVLVVIAAFSLPRLLGRAGDESASRATPPTPPLLLTAAPVPTEPTPATRPGAVVLHVIEKPATRPVMASIVAQPKPAPPPPAPVTLADAKAKYEAGQLVASRAIATDLLSTGKLSEADEAVARKLLHDISAVLVLSARRFADDPFGASYNVQSGELLQRIAPKFDQTAPFLCRINALGDPRRLRAGQTIKAIKGPFHAVVLKSKFIMDLWLGFPGEKGSVVAMSFPVGLGKDDSTPTGTWLVEAGKKLINPRYYSPRGEGVMESGDPKNPLGVRWIGLAGLDGEAVGKASYGIHGTNAPASIGKKESLGCVRMHNEDVELVFDMLSEGKSKVVVRE